MILLIIVGICGLVVLIIIATTYFKTDYHQEEISGNKQLVIHSISNLVYKCYEKNLGRSDSVICYQFKMNSTGEILSSDMLNGLDSSRIDISKVIVENLGSSGEIIIRYENEIIFIEKVENERISA